MGNFRWDGGSKRKAWDESVPTDSAVSFVILFLLYCSLISCNVVSGCNALFSNLLG